MTIKELENKVKTETKKGDSKMTHSEFVKLLFELYPVCPVCGENWLIHETENIATCACCEKEIIE